MISGSPISGVPISAARVTGGAAPVTVVKDLIMVGFIPFPRT